MVTEVSQNICRVNRIQSVDLRTAGLPDFAMDYLSRTQLKEANRLQERFRRNRNEVDAEVREVLVARMKEGCRLGEDQLKVFRELEEFFGGKGGGENGQK